MVIINDQVMALRDPIVVTIPVSKTLSYNRTL